MSGAGRAQTYDELVLSMNPLAYWPLDDASGTTVRDATGNNRTGTYQEGVITYRQAGQVGDAVQIANSGGGYPVTLSAGLLSALDPRAFTIAMLLKEPTVTGSKVYEGWNSDATPDYLAFEIRNGQLEIVTREATVGKSYYFGGAKNNQWAFYVLFNFESAGNVGLYVDREYLPAVRTGSGFNEPLTAPATGMFGGLGEATNLAQKVAFFDRMLTQSEVDSLYYKAFGQAAGAISYDISEDFATDYGDLTATDTGSKFTIANNKVSWSTVASAGVDPRAMGAAVASPPAGKALLSKLTAGPLFFGWGEVDTASPAKAAFRPHAGSIYLDTRPSGELVFGTYTNGGEYQAALIQRRIGTLYAVKGGTQYPNWTLLAITDTNPEAFYPGFGASINGAAGVGAFRLCNLPAPWDTSYGLALTRLAGKRAADDAFTHPADFLGEFNVVTAPSDGVIDYRFRVQDATNYWQVTVGSTGAVTLNEVVDGTPTQRATNATGVNYDGRVWIVASGQTIWVVVNGVAGSFRLEYASASNFTTETDGLLAGLGTGGVVGDIVVWPRTLPAAAATLLDEALA